MTTLSRVVKAARQAGKKPRGVRVSKRVWMKSVDRLDDMYDHAFFTACGARFYDAYVSGDRYSKRKLRKVEKLVERAIETVLTKEKMSK